MQENRGKLEGTFERQLIYALHHWLNFTCQISRIDLLAESSIRFPLIEYIERNLNFEKCYMERDYKDFLTEDIFNTNKYVDVMWTHNKKEYLIELKYINSAIRDPKEKQRYFNDLLRLSLALQFKKKDVERKCYFLICGDTTDFREILCGQIEQKETLNDVGDSIGKKDQKVEDTDYKTMLRLDNNSNAPESFYKEIVYNPAEGNPRFEDFIDEYFKGGTISEGRKRSRKKDKSKYKAYLKTFYTKKILILDDISHAKSVGLWEVTLSKNI